MGFEVKRKLRFHCAEISLCRSLKFKLLGEEMNKKISSKASSELHTQKERHLKVCVDNLSTKSLFYGNDY